MERDTTPENQQQYVYTYPRKTMNDIQIFHRIFIVVQLLGIGIVSIGWMGQLGAVIGLPTHVGIGIGIFLAISAVFQEFVDNDVITDPTVNVDNAFDANQQKGFYQSRYFLWAIMSLMIGLGAFQSFIRYESFMANALVDFGLKASMPWLYNALVYLVAGCSAMALMTLMVICYLKLFHRVLIKDYSNDTGFNEAEIADGVEHSNGVVPRFMTWLNQKVDFDFFMFMSMIFGSMIYFGAEFANVCAILYAFFPLMPTWQIIAISALNGTITFTNQMMLWGYNNKKFFVEHLRENGGKEMQFPWLDKLQCGMYVRRFVFYLRDFLLCVVDVMNAMLLVSMAYGKSLGISLIFISMINAWVKTYFQSCEEVKNAEGVTDSKTQALESTMMNKIFKGFFDGFGWLMQGFSSTFLPSFIWQGASNHVGADEINTECGKKVCCCQSPDDAHSKDKFEVGPNI